MGRRRMRGRGIGGLVDRVRPHRTRRGGAQGPHRGGRAAATCSLLALCVAFLPPAHAQPGGNWVTVAAYRCSLAFPPDWVVRSVLATQVPPGDTSLFGLLIVKGGLSRSGIVGAGPSPDSNVPPRLTVMEINGQDPVTLQEVWNHVRQQAAQYSILQQTEDGFATIAGRRAYYQYGVEHPLDGSDPLHYVLAYVANGHEGFMILGTTLNDPERIRRDFATISEILETFRIVPVSSVVERPSGVAHAAAASTRLLFARP